MSERDEVIVIPEAEPSGFVCPVCLAVAIGKKWASHANYCPDCGQHIKINTEKFSELKKKLSDLPWEEKEKCCRYYSVAAPEGLNGRMISGIYAKRLDNRGN